MFHRFSTWWRALGVVLLSLATVPWPSAAQALTSPTFTIDHQDVVAVLSASGAGRYSTTISLASRDPTTRVQVAIFPRLVERSQVAAITNGAGTTARPTAVTRLIPISCVHQNEVTITVDVHTRRPGPSHGPCAGARPRLRLRCSGARCDGVYPLRIAVSVHGALTTKWSLLVVQTTPVAQPLQVSLILTLDPSSWRHLHRAIAVLDTIGRHASPVTLSADYRTLVAVQANSPLSFQFQAALERALTSPLHQIVDAPPGFVDFAGLVANGLGRQVREQLSLSSDLLKTLTGRYVDGPVLLNGAPSVASLVALNHSGVSNVVIPEEDLSVAPSSTLDWGSPFHVEGAGPLSALTTDGPLSRLATDSSIEPGLRAALTLATLDFLHFEAPFASAPRTVVIEAPVALASAPYVNDLLASFRHDPFAQLATLSPSFNSALVGSNGAPSSRALASDATPSHWTGHNVSSLRTLIAGVTSYSDAVSSSNVGSRLRVAVASAETSGGPDVRQTAINAVQAALGVQLSNFSVDPSTITLAGPGTSLPITLLSRANYTVTAEVHLITDRLSFPKGNRFVIVMDSPTKSLRVPTAPHSGSNLTLQVVITTPDNHIVLARAAIQVRIAGTSIVGYLLTFASLVVLAYWWLRTSRRRHKGRHAR